MHRKSNTAIYTENLLKEQESLNDALKTQQIDLNLSGKQYTMIPFKLRSFGFLIKLNLSQNSLHSLPNFFHTNLVLLEELNLSNNLFNDLSHDFSNLKVLKTLNLSYNHFEFVPSVVLKLKSLKTLNLSHNSIESLPYLIDLENLESLDLRDNKIIELGGALRKLKNLKYLQVDYDKLLSSASDLVQKYGTRKDSIPSVTQVQKDTNTSEKRARAVIEVLESEQKYQKYLKYLFDEFYVPVRTGKMCEETVISKEDLESMLPLGLEPILNLSAKLLKSLTDTIDIENNSSVNASKIGKIFINFSPFMKMYADYCAEYHKCSSNVQYLMKSNENFEDYLMKKSENDAADRLLLSSVLVMPIQRIMRYGMLIRAVIAYSGIEHPDYNDLLIAATKMEEMARLIDSKVDDYRISSKTVQLTSELSLTFNRTRRYICEGEYYAGNDQYHIYLFSDMFVFCKIDLLGKIFGFSNKMICLLVNLKAETKHETLVVKHQNYEWIFTDSFWKSHILRAMSEVKQ